MNHSPRGPRFSSLTRFLRAGTAGLILALFCVPVFAEVSVVTDAQGKYLKTLVITDHRGARQVLWGRVRPGVDTSKMLNVEGDRLGDSRPVVLEQPGTRQPWVIWSASDGNDREIAFAVWSGGHWQGPQLVERVDNPYDDLNPRLAFDSTGSPVVVWWREEPIPRVYLSRLINGEWTPSSSLSAPDTPSRHPSIRMSDSRAVISFHTPSGLTVLFLDLTAPAIHPEGNGPLDGPVPPPDLRQNPGGGTDTRDGGIPAGSAGIERQKPVSNN